MIWRILFIPQGLRVDTKGSMIEHRNVIRLMVNSKFQFDFNNNDVWACFIPIVLIFQYGKKTYGALLYGGKLIIISSSITKDIYKYLQLLKDERVTILNQTPTMFYNLADEEVKFPTKELNLRYVIFGGEALKPIKLKEWHQMYPNTKLVNMYGITETTVHATYKEITEDEIILNQSNIGKPIPTLTTYIMDSNQNLCPLGALGELYIGGEGVGRGYLNRPELTVEKFISNPYKPQERLYRSGDLARYLPNGEIEYLGRVDNQIKIRGFRVELGEIENQLLKHNLIKEVVMVAKISRLP